ncbi:uncharacterized protein [Miscanthus floridulus]|uniref:uncharacterized protein n=1 Tax=Miscanthus floridulus TaxID=154761 RepID=UPI0034586C9C
MVADAKYLDWLEHPITSSRANQWVDIPYPGRFPLMLDPTIRNILIDGGSALNVLFARALTELGLTKDNLVLVDSPFWGIIPSRASQPLGQITLPVQFGSIDHFCTEYMNFFVADFDTTYHTILGQLALTKFMVVTHYVYLVLKIPIEQGVLSLHANISTAYECEREGLAIAKVMDLSARMEACIADWAIVD